MAGAEAIPRAFPQKKCNASGWHDLKKKNLKKGKKPNTTQNYCHKDHSAPWNGGCCWGTEGASFQEGIRGFSINRE